MATTKFQPGTRVIVKVDDGYTPAEYQGPGEVREYDGQSVVVDLDSGQSTQVLTDFVELEEPETVTVIVPYYDAPAPDELELEGEDAQGWTLLSNPENIPGLLDHPKATRLLADAAEAGRQVYYRPGRPSEDARLRIIEAWHQCMVVDLAAGAVPALEVVDVDQLVRAAGGSPYDPEPLDLLRDADGEHTGVMRRLDAALSSMLHRADANSALHVALAQGDPAESSAPGNPKTWAVPFSWVSLGGEWSRRAWAATGAVEIEVDSYLSTKIRATGVEITVVGRGGATRFTGEALGGYVGRAVRAALAREQARELIGHTSCIGDTPVQESEAWSPERFAAHVATRRTEGGWFVGRTAFLELPGLPR